jgi:hypothetical protein
MSKLDDAMEQNMAYIVIHENRPFCYRDFLRWNDAEKEWGMKHKTFRNKISKLMKAGKAKFCYNSGRAFYTIEGYDFGKPVTPSHTVVHNDPVYSMIQNLPADKQSIHNIRLRFSVAGIWTMLSNNPKFHKNHKSQDIAIPTWNKNNALVRATIHKTDTVSVTIGCSLQPTALDGDGIIFLFNLLVRVEERLQALLDSCRTDYDECNTSIPDHGEWVVTMWHFGRDGLLEYTGEKFSITIDNTQHILTRIYSKDFGKQTRIRRETQEYPNKTVFDAIEQKLSHNFENEREMK